MRFLDYLPDEPIMQVLLAGYIFGLAILVCLGMKFLLWLMKVVSPDVPLPTKFSWEGWIITSLTLGAGIVARELMAKLFK